VNNDWQNMNPAESPAARAHGGVAYDRESDRVVLFGGSAGPDETHLYDVNAKVRARLALTTRPSGRMAHAMAYDDQSDRGVLFGGSWPPGLVTDPSVVNFNDTWSYDARANAWFHIEVVTPPGVSPVLIASVAGGVLAAVAIATAVLLRRRRRVP